MPLLRGLLAVLAVTTLAGCATTAAESRTVHQFAAQFDCPGAHVQPSPGGYRVDGCGSSAFYRCVKNPPQMDTRLSGSHAPYAESSSRYGATQQDDAASALLEGLWESATEEASTSVACALEPSSLGGHGAQASERSILPLTTTPHQAALALASQSAPLTLSLTLATASLELYADPVRSPDYVLLAIHGASLGLYEACKPWVFHDGARLTVSALQVVAADRLHWVVPSRELRSLRHSARVDGNVCGLRFALDAAQREQLADFALQLRR